MKRHFSSIVMMVTMLVFGTFREIEASTFFLKVGGEVVESAITKLTSKGIGTVAARSFVLELVENGLKNLDEVVEGVIKNVDSLGGKSVDEMLDPTMFSQVTKNFKGTLKSIKSAGVDVAQFGTDDLMKISAGKGDDVIQKITYKGIGPVPKGKISELTATKILTKAKNSAKILDNLGGTSSNRVISSIKSGASSTVKKIKSVFTTTTEETMTAAQKAERAGYEALTHSPSVAERQVGHAGMARMEKILVTSPLGRAARYYGGYAGMGLAGAIGITYTAVMFMLPSLYQSKMLAEQHKNAMLETYLPPVKFGNIVMQLPDSVVDMNNPFNSQWIYYGIPVNNPGEDLSAAAKAAYPGVSNATKKNKLSASIQSGATKLASFGAAKKISIPRYNLDAKALATLPMFVSYSTQSYVPYASSGIPDPTFSQAMLNLNTGQVIFADGTPDGTPAVPLIGPKQQTGFDTIQSFMSVKLGALKTMGMQASYTEFQQAYSSVKAGKVSSPLAAQFDCACLQSNNGVLSTNMMKACAAGKSCLLTSTLNQLAAGLVINSQGQELQSGQDLAKEVANGALGQVIPIQGLGDQFNKILQLFPGAQQNALANSGALTVSLGSNLQAATAPVVQGADPDNYVAKGVYIYQCKNTPLAKIMRSQSGGSQGANSQITDFIVFLDANLNQVPMMAPVSDPKNYNFIKMGLNPAIKYFSTVIGDVDSDGSFTFLPQLNIQSPAALVAKGLPATFAPLYGLQATKGSLAINYNQNLPAVISGIAQTLSSNPKLGQQFKIMQSAMLGQLTAGPYGKYSLSPVSEDMQPSIGGVTLMMYTGFNSYPVSQDQASSACSDVLIPISAQDKTVTLPSNNVAQYYGLVTDFTYTVLADGSITVGAGGYANSSFNPTTWSIDVTKASQYYWIDKLTAMGQGSDPNFVMPQALVDFVQTARNAWIRWIKSTPSSPEYLGIKVAGTSNVLTIASQQALQNGLYVYYCSPCPSSAPQDYFVLTNSSLPRAQDRTLGSMSATKATATTNMVSLISGILYDATGTPVAGAPMMNAATLLKSIQAAKPKAIANDLAIKLNIAVAQTASTAMAMVYPFQFGGLQLGMYQVDVNTNTYLYFDASGAGASANFQPSDYFVSVDSYTNPSSAQTALSGSTAYMISLVSGEVYDPTGVVATMPMSLVSQIIASLSPSWRSGIADQIANLTDSLAQAAQVEAAQTAAMNNAPVPNSGLVTWPQASAMQVINAVAQLDFLAEPYSMLKQDPTSGMYVLVTPANAEGTQFLYTFFNVPSSIVDASGKATNVGATYDGQGNLLRVIQGLELASMLRQLGVAIDNAGKQYLGATNSLPIMQLDPADIELRPGISGKSMLYSNDPQFPSHGIVSPVSYNNAQFYFYYNTITQAYYAMKVNGSDICYIDMAGGSVYNLNGSSRVAANPVAVNANGDVKDLFLPYLNPDGFVRCCMKNADNNNAYSDFLNSEQDFQPFAVDPATNNSCGLNLLYSLDAAAVKVNIAQMPFPETLTAMPDLSMTNQYNVYFDSSSTPVVYNVNPAYTWQQLQLLPIDMNSRALLNPLPDDQYNNASLVMQGNKMYALLFAGQFFSDAQSIGNNVYTMTSGANKVAVAIKVDAKTNVQYISVAAGGNTYNYQSAFLTLSEGQLSDVRRNAWQVETVVDVMGNILLASYLSVDASGNVQLTPVNISSVVNVPTDAASKSALNANLGNILQDKGNGKFVVGIPASTYPYVTQDSYVDLENGVLFDATGLLLGYTLQINDMLPLLSQLSVSVVRDSNNNPVLAYRSSSAAQASAPVAQQKNVMKSSVVSKKAAASSVAPTYDDEDDDIDSDDDVDSSPSTSSAVVASPRNTGIVPPSINSPVPAVTSQPQAAVKNPQISAENIAKIKLLQQDIAKERADTRIRQAQLKREKVAKRKKTIQNAIKMNNDQIAADNKQIALLSTAASSRSDILGRLSSDGKKKHTPSQKKSKQAAMTKAMKGMTL
ncbi:MAG: hypothetical protein Q8Q60_04200 [Candidatus Chromulinivorax sp.]|nr:hypothetical protein [Candidatus Chromulinivorax sp.]